MKITFFSCLIMLIGLTNHALAQGFSSSAQQWDIPIVSDFEEYLVSSGFHQVIDMNGDGKPDFVDSENEATNPSDVFQNGNQKYWKVYLNTGNGFSNTAIQWNIPIVSDFEDYLVSSGFHQLVDMNGDGKPDFVDSENEATNPSDVFQNGNQKFWKVYLNTGNGFSSTATQWNIPIVSDDQDYLVSSSFHQVVDMDGDGKPDFVDSENEATNPSDVFQNGNQKYWKVYLNTGSGFSSTATQWNIPIVSDDQDYLVSSSFHQVIDMDGDGKPDFVDSENEGTNPSDVFQNGNQKYWKLYKNTGNGFSITATQWNIPIVSDDQDYYISSSFHQVIDMDGDGKPDFVDSENEATNPSDVFQNGNQKYWKLYLNTGSGFSSTATQWNIPIVSDNQDYYVSSDLHRTIDMNGDLKPDFVDSENEATNPSDVFLNGNQKYWKVYLNTAILGTKDFTEKKIVFYPNPVKDILNISFDEKIISISIYNFTGQEVLSKPINANEIAINVSNLPAGTYLVKVNAGDNIKTVKVVKL